MRALILDVDWSDGRRIGIERALRAAIRSGQLMYGASVPSSRTLAADLGVARATVVSAYEQLIAEGYLVARSGVGTTVGKIKTIEPTPSLDIPSTPRWAGDFRAGEPDGGLFPRSAWARSIKKVLSESPDSVFGYSDPQGRPELRDVLSRYLARSRAVMAPPDLINVVGGVTSSVTLLGQMFSRLGITTVAVEDPSLPILHHGLKLAGISVVPVEVDAEGLVVDGLEALGVKAVLVTPSHQYPMGVSLSRQRRAQLVDWARRTGGWIIEDDYDGEFRYDRQPLGALQGLETDRIIYVGTASKLLAPGLRLAWMALPAELQPSFTRARGMQSVTSTIDQLALVDFIERGEMDRHLRRVKAVYHRRHRSLVEEIEANVAWLEVSGIEAGLHLAGHIRDRRISEADVVHELERKSIRIVGLSQHFVGKPRFEGLVFGYTRIPQHAFSTAVELLIDVLCEQ